MDLPVFLLADNTDYEDMYIVHLEFPRFVMNVNSGDVEWLEEFSQADQNDLETEGPVLIERAMEFYERELARYEEQE